MRRRSSGSSPARLDLHVRSNASADGESSLADHAHRALALGLEEVGFCEHVDLDPRDRHCGHLDLVKRYGTACYGPFDPGQYRYEICDILQAAIQQGMAVEVNTSGWRQAPGEPYPSPAILTWYCQPGGERVTIGSDAHSIDHLGEGVASAQDLLRQIGFRAVVSFEGRRLHWLDL